MNSWNPEEIATAFADAAADASLWDAAMDNAARVTGSVGAALLPIRGRLPGVPISQSLGELFTTYFRDGWSLRDERCRGIPTMIRDGVMSDLDFAKPDEFSHKPYYQELLAPFGLRWFAGVKVAAGDDLWCLAIQRSIEQGPPSRDDLRRLSALSKSLSSAAALARAFGFATANAAVEAFEISGSAVALLNRRGEVLRLNRAAEDLLSPDLRIAEQRIISRDREATVALDRALNALLWAGTSSALMPPVALPRHMRRPILAYPIKLSAVSASVFGECQALLVFVDLERRVRPPQEALHSSFALTPAEARLAIRMASGAALETVADELKITKQTARNQLKVVFQKTDVHRQAELVALLASVLSQR